MEAFLSWVGAALGALFVVAVAVAWWEHLVHTARPPTRPEPAAPRTVSIDVQLDALPDSPPQAPPPALTPSPVPAGDAAQRRATLDGAISRMARTAQDNSAWTETSPMVLHSATDTPPDSTPAAENTAAPAAAASPSATRA